MGTRADFYIGRGKQAEWIGSIAWDGYEFDEDNGNSIAAAKTKEEFISSVNSMLKNRRDATFPKDGWPWPWEDSRTTDYAYAFDCGVWVSIFGCEWYKPGQYNDDLKEDKVDFPDMSKVKNVNLGDRSGLIVIG